NGLPAECEMPQAFCKDVSVIWAEATAWSSVTRFVTEKKSPFDVVADPEMAQQRPSRAIALVYPRIRTHIIWLRLLSSRLGTPRWYIGSHARNQGCCGAPGFRLIEGLGGSVEIGEKTPFSPCFPALAGLSLPLREDR